MIELTEDQILQIQDWIYENPQRYAGMTYSDGVQDMLDVLTGNATIEDLLGE